MASYWNTILKVLLGNNRMPGMQDYTMGGIVQNPPNWQDIVGKGQIPGQPIPNVGNSIPVPGPTAQLPTDPITGLPAGPRPPNILPQTPGQMPPPVGSPKPGILDRLGQSQGGLLGALTPLLIATLGGKNAGYMAQGYMGQQQLQQDRALEQQRERRLQQATDAQIGMQRAQLEATLEQRRLANEQKLTDDAQRLVSDLEKQWLSNPSRRPQSSAEAVRIALDQASAIGLPPASGAKIATFVRSAFDALPPKVNLYVGPKGEVWTEENKPPQVPEGTLVYNPDQHLYAKMESERRVALAKPGAKQYTILTSPGTNEPIGITRASGDQVLGTQRDLMSPDEQTFYDAYVDAFKRGIGRSEEQRREAELARDRRANKYAENRLDVQTISKANAIAQSFEATPIVKNYNETQNRYQTVKKIVETQVGGPQDLATVFEFMKGLDPTSVVRESEYATAAKSGNIFAGMFARFNGYLKEEGGFLPDNVKKQFLNILNAKLNASEAQYDNVRKAYGARINRITGKNDGEEYLTDFKAAFKQWIKVRNSRGEEFEVPPENLPEAIRRGGTVVQ